jgi:hypothetical protein
MLKRIMACAAVAAISFAVNAQRSAPAAGSTCPAGMRSATIRHTMVKPGEWATFAKAVADHTAWYAAHKDGTRTVLGRVSAPAAKGGLSATEAVTITYYSGKPMPDRDAAYSAFTAKYRASSTLKDEMRTCLSA